MAPIKTVPQSPQRTREAQGIGNGVLTQCSR